MDGPEAVREIAKQVGGKITEMGRLPDGSGFARMLMPLRKDHWIHDGDRKESYGVFNVPPMPFRKPQWLRDSLPLANHGVDACKYVTMSHPEPSLRSLVRP